MICLCSAFCILLSICSCTGYQPSVFYCFPAFVSELSMCLCFATYHGVICSAKLNMCLCLLIFMSICVVVLCVCVFYFIYIYFFSLPCVYRFIYLCLSHMYRFSLSFWMPCVLIFIQDLSQEKIFSLTQLVIFVDLSLVYKKKKKSLALSNFKREIKIPWNRRLLP